MGNILDQDIQGYSVKEISIAAVGAYFGCQLLKYSWWRYKIYKSLAKGRRILAERNEKQFTFKEVSNANFIISLTVTELREHLIKGTFTSVDLVNVFGKRCYTIGRELGLTTEENFTEALIEAEIKDAQRAEAIKNGTMDKLPPLHGIPMSIKDNISEKGKMTSIGCSFMCDKKQESDSVTVRLMKEAGAILLVRGNMVQVAYAIHTDNYVWGRAQNPWDRSRSSGGSSGGEAGLLAARCVPLGIGTDIGGSLRVPAAFVGVCTFKPTGGRVSTLGHKSALAEGSPVFNHIVSASGPMAKSVDDVLVTLKVLMNPKINYYDASICPQPFREDLYETSRKGGIKVGYISSLETIPATGAMKRAIKIAKEALEKKGYELIPMEFTTEEILAYRDVYIGLVFNAYFIPLMKRLDDEGELPMSVYTQARISVNLNFILKAIVKGILYLSGNHRMLSLIRSVQVKSGPQLDQLVMKKFQLVEQMRERWQRLGIEAVITPAFPHCAFSAANVKTMYGFADYNLIWNTLHYPGGIVPVTQVLEGEDNPDTYTDVYNDKWTSAIKTDMQNTKGMPLCVQIVGFAWQDEVALGVMKSLEEEVNFNKYPDI